MNLYGYNIGRFSQLIVSSTKANITFTHKKNESIYHFTPFSKITLKLITQDLNVKHKLIELLENTIENLDNLEFSNDFFR